MNPIRHIRRLAAAGTALTDRALAGLRAAAAVA